MALFDDVNKTLGKAMHGIADAAQGIGESTQKLGDMTLEITKQGLSSAAQGISETAQFLGNTAQDIGENISDTARSFQEHTRTPKIEKCPHCGEILNGITAVCPSCGFDLYDAKIPESVLRLTREIEKLEDKRASITVSIATKISGRMDDSIDEKIALLIRNHIVPNTKNDIIEFMLLAAGHMDAKVLAQTDPFFMTATVVDKAWESKFQQTYQKAKVAFGDDPDFQKIQEIYDKKKEEIEKERPKKEQKSFFGLKRRN